MKILRLREAAVDFLWLWEGGVCKFIFMSNPTTVLRLILPKIRTFAANPDHFRATFIKKVRNRTKVRKIGPKWRDCGWMFYSSSSSKDCYLF